MLNKLSQAIVSLALFVSIKAFSTELAIVTEHLAPFQIVDKDSISGLATEIVLATLNASAVDYTLDVHPWALAYERATQQSNTCIYSLARLPMRETQFKWIGHIASGTSSFYSLNNRKIDVSTVADAKHFKTAVIEDDVTHHFLLAKGFVENQHLYASSNYDTLLNLLEVPSRNIDLVIINDDLMHYRLGSSNDIHKYHKLFRIDELKLDFHLACSISTEQDIVDKLSVSMNDLEQNGTLSRIRQKWRATLKTPP